MFDFLIDRREGNVRIFPLSEKIPHEYQILIIRVSFRSWIPKIVASAIFDRRFTVFYRAEVEFYDKIKDTYREKNDEVLTVKIT